VACGIRAGACSCAKALAEGVRRLRRQGLYEMRRFGAFRADSCFRAFTHERCVEHAPRRGQNCRIRRRSAQVRAVYNGAVQCRSFKARSDKKGM